MKFQAKIWKDGNIWYFKFRDNSYSFGHRTYRKSRHVSYTNGDKFNFSETVNLREMNRCILNHLLLVRLLQETKKKLDISQSELTKLELP